MLSVFRAIIDRLKALFASRAALELEADCLAQHAERQAELLRLADRYEAEGLCGIAANLRHQVEEASFERPLASVLPALTHLGCAEEREPSPALRLVAPPNRTPEEATSTQAARLTAKRKQRQDSR